MFCTDINESIALFAVLSSTALLFIYTDKITEGWWDKNKCCSLFDRPNKNAVCVEAQLYKCNIQNVGQKSLF